MLPLAFVHKSHKSKKQGTPSKKILHTTLNHFLVHHSNSMTSPNAIPRSDLLKKIAVITDGLSNLKAEIAEARQRAKEKEAEFYNSVSHALSKVESSAAETHHHRQAPSSIHDVSLTATESFARGSATLRSSRRKSKVSFAIPEDTFFAHNTVRSSSDGAPPEFRRPRVASPEACSDEPTPQRFRREMNVSLDGTSSPAQCVEATGPKRLLRPSNVPCSHISGDQRPVSKVNVAPIMELNVSLPRGSFALSGRMSSDTQQSVEETTPLRAPQLRHMDPNTLYPAQFHRTPPRNASCPISSRSRSIMESVNFKKSLKRGSITLPCEETTIVDD